ISFLLKTVEALPVYRRIDPGEDVSKNFDTFEAAHRRLREGGSIALFPEGVSHNSPKLLPIKTGAARIALGAVAAGEGSEPITLRIVPVGLYYTNKTTFRSEALLHFGESFDVAPAEPDADGQPSREAVRELTDRIENALREVTLNAENDAELTTAAIAERVFRTTLERDDLRSRLAFKQKYLGGADAEGGMRLSEKLDRFAAKLGEAGLEPEHLSLANLTRGFVVRRALLGTWYLLMLSPVAIIGTIIHFPAYQLSKLLSRVITRHGADDIASTVKVLGGIVFMPLTWLIAAGVVYYFFGWEWASLSLPLAFVSGYVALISLESLAELSGWGRAILHFFFDRDAFLRLYVERREIQEELARLNTANKKDG
ncbi:MAG TPA: 1-acyl-sn-glycerol-3-phosphate acyltransferase, partial [Pyrinomonadaceae bacterium]|nr:1-acyl-sn-glycerol-3-phosphate acyltransferase [Pyrinomonadaceae bacterium]